jgi:hypothetical protein
MLINLWDGRVLNTHPCMLPRAIKGDQKAGHREIIRSVEKFLKTVYVMMPPTCGYTGGAVFRIDFKRSACWRTAREGGA